MGGQVLNISNYIYFPGVVTGQTFIAQAIYMVSTLVVLYIEI
jgi:hypothetical protein